MKDNNIKKNYPALIEDLIPNVLSLGQIQKVLQNLLRERVPIRDLVTILESLYDFAHSTKDTDILTEFVRQSLSATITKIFQTEEGEVRALTLDPKTEQIFDEAIKQARQKGGEFIIPPNAINKLYKSISKKYEEILSQGLSPIILCSPNIRMYFRKLIEPVFPGIIILSYSEISPSIKIESMGGVCIENDN